MEYIFIVVVMLAAYLGYRFMFGKTKDIRPLEEDKPKDEKISAVPDVAPVKIRKTRTKKVTVKT